MSSSAWLLSLNDIMPLRSIHIVKSGRIFLGFMTEQYSILYICINICMLHYPLIHWWTLRLFSCLSYHKQCHSEHGNADITLRYWFHFLQLYTQKGIARSYGSSIFNFLRNLHTVLHSGYTSLHSTNSVQAFPFLHILAKIYLLSLKW